MVVRELSHFPFFALLLVLGLVVHTEATAVLDHKIDDKHPYTSVIDSSLETTRGKLLGRRFSHKKFHNSLESSDENRKIKEISSLFSPKQDDTAAVHGKWTALSDLSDDNLVVASVYVLNQIILGNSPFNVTLSASETASYEIHILSAKLQMVTGLNLNFSMVVLLDHNCVGVFEALVHLDLEGNPEISQWGSDSACSDVKGTKGTQAVFVVDDDTTSPLESSDAPTTSPSPSFAISPVSSILSPTGVPAIAPVMSSQIQETLTPTVSPLLEERNAPSPGASESSVSIRSNGGQNTSALADSNWIPTENTNAPDYQLTASPTISPAPETYHVLSLNATEPSESMINYKDSKPSVPPDRHWIPIENTDEPVFQPTTVPSTLIPPPTKTSELGFPHSNLNENKVANIHVSKLAYGSLVSSKYQQTNVPTASPTPTIPLESGSAYRVFDTKVPTVSPAPAIISESGASYRILDTNVPTISPAPTKIHVPLVSFNFPSTTAPIISLTPTKYSDISPAAMESLVSKISYEDRIPTAAQDSHWIPIEKTTAPTTGIPAHMNGSDTVTPYDIEAILSLSRHSSTASPTGSDFLSDASALPSYIRTVTSNDESGSTTVYSTSFEKPPIGAAPVPSIGWIPCIGFAPCPEGCS